MAKHLRALTKLWVNARVPLIAGGVVLVLVVGGLLGYQRHQADAEADEQRTVQETAQRLAEEVSRSFVQAAAAVAGAINEDNLAKWLASSDVDGQKATGERLVAKVDVARAATLVPVAVDEIDDSVSPPIGYAVLDLLRQSKADGEAPPPEVHQLGEEEEGHVVVLTRISNPKGELVGHVRWALDIGVLSAAFAGVALPEGYAELFQPVAGAKPLVIATSGQATFRQGPALYTAAVRGTAWRVGFWPAVTPQSASPELGLGAAPIAGLLVVMLAGAGLVVLRRRKRAPAEDLEEAPAYSGEAVAVGASVQADDGLGAGSPIDIVDAIEVEEAASASAPGSPSAGPSAISPGIFRAYDIRGVVGETLSVDVVREIGRAIGSEAYDRGQQTVVVGADGRLSGPELSQALIEGLRASGRDVIDVGRVPTPVLYFATHYLNTGSGVMVTGSHNPPNYNGLKIMLGGDTLFGEAITALRTRIEAGQLTTGEGSLQSMDVIPEYIRRVTEDIPVALGNAFKVVIDCGNGIAGDVAPKLIRALGHDVIELFCEVDGHFPNHHPDPSKPENLRDLISAVAENKADIGFGFDGDGDRLGIVDGTGRVIWPDLQMMLYARDILSRNPGACIVYDVKCSGRLGKVIEKLGGKPLMWKTGHSFIKSKMKEESAMLAGEMSGHIFFKERWYGFDDAMYAAARMLELLLALKSAPAKVFAKLPTGVATPELSVEMQEGAQHEFMAKLAESADFGDAEVATIDGLRADYKDGWGLVRASNTTSSLVLRFEGDSQEALERIQAQFRALLLGQDPGLSLPF